MILEAIMGFLRPSDTTYFIHSPQRSVQAGEDVIKIEGPPCTWDCCCQVTFNLYKAEDEDEIKVAPSSRPAELAELSRNAAILKKLSMSA